MFFPFEASKNEVNMKIKNNFTEQDKIIVKLDEIHNKYIFVLFIPLI